MEKIVKKIVLFLAVVLITGAVLALIGFAGYIVYFLVTAILNHRPK